MSGDDVVAFVVVSVLAAGVLVVVWRAWKADSEYSGSWRDDEDPSQ